jgi:hypothetical protein
MNCSNPATAKAAAYRLPEQLKAVTARKLLLTAASRQHVAVTQHMIRLPVTVQHIDANTLEAMIAQLLACWRVEAAACIELLCVMPAAAQLSSEAAARLLLEGLRQIQPVPIGQLWNLAGAQQMSSELITELLVGCAQVHKYPEDPLDDCLNMICTLPAAEALSSTEFVQLLEAVFECDFDMQQYANDQEATSAMDMYFSNLFYLPAAVELSTEQRMQLIHKTVVCDSAVAMHRSSLWFIAERLSSKMLLQSLQAVVEAGRGECAAELCGVRAARQFGSGAVAQLLQAAADPMCIASLCQLPAAQELSCEAVAELLATVVKEEERGPYEEPLQALIYSPISMGYIWRSHRVRRGSSMLVFELPAAKALCSATVVQLLHAAAEHGSTACTTALCNLPGAGQISRAAVARLLRTSLQFGHHECTQQMCMLPAAQSFSREQVLEVFEMAAQHECDATIRILCKELPAAAQLSREMSAAMQWLQK